MQYNRHSTEWWKRNSCYCFGCHHRSPRSPPPSAPQHELNAPTQTIGRPIQLPQLTRLLALPRNTPGRSNWKVGLVPRFAPVGLPVGGSTSLNPLNPHAHPLPTHGVHARARSPRQGHSGCELLAPQAGPTAPQASPPDIPAFLVVFCSLWAGFLAVFGPFENALRQGFPIFKNPKNTINRSTLRTVRNRRRLAGAPCRGQPLG